MHSLRTSRRWLDKIRHCIFESTTRIAQTYKKFTGPALQYDLGIHEGVQGGGIHLGYGYCASRGRASMHSCLQGHRLPSASLPCRTVFLFLARCRMIVCFRDGVLPKGGIAVLLYMRSFYHRCHESVHKQLWIYHRPVVYSRVALCSPRLSCYVPRITDAGSS